MPQPKRSWPSVKVSADKAILKRADVTSVLTSLSLRQLPMAPSAARALKKQARAQGFTGAWGTSLVLAARGSRVAAPWWGLIGLGKEDEEANKLAEGARRSMARLIGQARSLGLKQIAVDLRSKNHLMRAMIEGAVLANYRFTDRSGKLAQQNRQQAIRGLTFLVEKEDLATARRMALAVRAELQGALLTRRLVNEPAGHMTPKVLVQEAQAIAKENEDVTVSILKREALQDGWPAFLAVARGSQEEPYVIHLAYTPKRPRKGRKKIFLVGKGITFDSGGLSLKPGSGMETMKIDMAGAATVLGVFASLSKLEIDVEVHGVIAACENMPSGEAYRPGDVVPTRLGKTVEILNTDAEGRVTLADALTYAAEHEPDAIIDLATLTGSCVVGLGETYAGLWSTNDTLRRDLISAATTAGEGVVAMPLPEEYVPLIASKVADLRNTAMTRWGDAIMAALFLREFVGDISWAHIDIAGPAYAERDILPYWGGNSATGFGVRTLLRFLAAIEKKTEAD